VRRGWLRLPQWLRAWRAWINPVPLAAGAMTLVFGWIIIFGDQGLLTLRSLHHTSYELRHQTQRLTLQLEDLKEEQRRLEDRDYLEILIRQELGLVKPGETIYQFTTDAAPPDDTQNNGGKKIP